MTFNKNISQKETEEINYKDVIDQSTKYKNARELLAKILKLERKNFNTALIKILKKYGYHREKKERINYLTIMYLYGEINNRIKKMKESLDKDDKIEFYEKRIEKAITNGKPFNKQLYNEYINNLSINKLKKLADTIKNQKRTFVYRNNNYERDESDGDVIRNDNTSEKIDNMRNELKKIEELIQEK